MKNTFLLFLLVFMASCAKTDLTVTVKSPVFQCCNIWGETATAYDVFETLPDFLEGENIEYSDLIVNNNGEGALCGICCKCPTEKIVEFKVSEEDLQTLLDLGFEE